MRSLKLDFLHPYPSLGWPAWLLLAAGLALAGGALWQDRQLELSIAAETAEQQRLAPAYKPQKPRIIPGMAVETTQLARDQLALPWNTLFTRLEKVQSKNIALVSLEADGRKTDATLTAEARTLADMLAYVEVLKKEAGFHSVTLSQHALQEEDRELPYRFVLRIRWRN